MNASTHTEFAVDEFIDADDSRLTEVTVFTSQAYVKRRADLRTAPGLNRYQFELLAYKVDAESVQARVFGEGEILSVQHRTVPAKVFPQERLQQLVQQKETLLLQLKTLKSRQAIKDKQIAFLDGVVQFSQTEIPKKLKTEMPTTADLKSMLEFLGSNFEDLSKAALDIEKKMIDLDKDLAVIEQQLKDLRGPRIKLRNVIEVLFNATREQKAEIELCYVTTDASWEPVYKVEVPEDFSRVGLTMFARIEQKTGEDWSDVKPSVSNAVPMQGTALPVVGSWNLKLPPKQPMPLAMPMAAMAAAPPAEETEVTEDEVMFDALDDLDVGAKMPESEYQQAEQQELPLAFEYHLKQAVHLASGGGDTLLPLFSRDLSGDFFIYTAPKIDPLGYLVCQITADSALLPGRLNVHFGGRFVGGTQLSEKRAGEELLVNLGVETGLKVRREKTVDKVAETFFGKVERAHKARELEFIITIENLKDLTMTLHVLDAVPVSRTDRIQVKGLELSPKPSVTDYQQHEGVMQWDLKVEPRSTQQVVVRFFVKHPKDLEPQGL